MESWRKGRQEKRNSSEGQEHINSLFRNTEGVQRGDEFLFCVHHSSAVRRQVNDAFERISYNSDNVDSYCWSREKPEQYFVSGTKTIWQKKANLGPTTLSKRCTYGHRRFNTYSCSLTWPAPEHSWCVVSVSVLSSHPLFTILLPFCKMRAWFPAIQNLPMVLCLEVSTAPGPPTKGHLSTLASGARAPLTETPWYSLSICWKDAFPI